MQVRPKCQGSILYFWQCFAWPLCTYFEVDHYSSKEYSKTLYKVAHDVNKRSSDVDVFLMGVGGASVSVTMLVQGQTHSANKNYKTSNFCKDSNYFNAETLFHNAQDSVLLSLRSR